MPEEEIFDLEASIKVLCATFDEIKSAYIFGSRRFNSKSTRSDIDILLVVEGNIKESKLRDFTLEHCMALDLFLVIGGKAKSVANESFIEATDNDSLIKELNAVLLYEKGSGTSPELAKMKSMAIDRRVEHILTSLPNSSTEYYEVNALKKYFKTARENGLPAKPYLGTSTKEASDFIVSVLLQMIDVNHNVTNYGAAKSGWTKNIDSEYDFQNLLWITIKPWLPGLNREQVAITYDNQQKKSDFSLFKDQLVIELKHIKDDGDKRETVKTLEGLKNFYVQHPNIRVLLFVILVEKDVQLDDKKWEEDFTYEHETPSVKTAIIRNR